MRRQNRKGRSKNRGRDAIALSILQSASVEEHTGAETRYLGGLIQSKTPVSIKLITNEEVSGWIEYYDKNMIRVTRDNAPNVFVYKDEIKYIIEL